MDDHTVIVYRANFGWTQGQYVFVVDCEEHLVSIHSGLFIDAIGRALLHRGAALR